MHHCTKSINHLLSFYENGKRVKAEYYLSKYPDTKTDSDCQTSAQRLNRLTELKRRAYQNNDGEQIGQCQTKLDECNERVRHLESRLQEFQEQCQTEKQVLEVGKNDIQLLYDGLLEESDKNAEAIENLKSSLEEAINQQTSLQTDLDEAKKVSKENIDRLELERTELQRQLTKITAARDKLIASAKSGHIDREALRDELESMNQTITLIRNEKDQISGELQQKINEITATRDTLIESARSGEIDRQTLLNDLEATRETIARIQLEKNNLEDERKELKDASKRGEIDKQTLTEQLGKIREQMSVLKTEHGSKVQELNTLREQYETTSKQSVLNEQRFQELDSQFRECEEKRGELVRSLESANSENGSLKLKLDESKLLEI